MAIFYPKCGNVLICDFDGYIFPEIVKRRPVVVISPNGIVRKDLCTIVPLSTTPPDEIRAYHYLLKGNPIPGSSELVVWAKCDLVATVCYKRLDRIQVGRRNYTNGAVSMEQVREIRRCAAISIGIEFGDT